MITNKRRPRLRLPNGLGSAHLIGDEKARRRPWRARVSCGAVYNKDLDQWQRRYLTLGYFETEQEAIAALYDYHRDPYTLEAATVTFAGLFHMWKNRKYPEISVSAQRGYEAAFKNSRTLHNLKMRDIRTDHMEQILAATSLQHGSQTMMKSLWNQLFQYAMERDIVQKNYASFIHLRDPAPQTRRTAISPEDREALWRAADGGNWTARVFLIYCYTGMRSSELLAVKKSDVDLENRILVGGLKTEAGKNRRIPLHRDILPIIRQFMDTPGEFLIMENRRGYWAPLTYNRWYYILFKRMMAQLGMNYTGHYARHTCATMLREANVADDLRKLILGHANGDITDRYTHHPDYMLVDAIDQIPRRKGRKKVR